MRAFDTAIQECGLPDPYLVGDFEDVLTETGARILLCDVEENDLRDPWALQEIAAIGAWAEMLGCRARVPRIASEPHSSTGGAATDG